MHVIYITKPCLPLVHAGTLGWMPWTYRRYPYLVFIAPYFFGINKYKSFSRLDKNCLRIAFSEIDKYDSGLLIELWDKGMLWDKAIGYFWAPLHFLQFTRLVRFSKLKICFYFYFYIPIATFGLNWTHFSWKNFFVSINELG